jgi:SNF2 family DNA or RNA helicase
MKLYKHQENVLELSKSMPELALFWEMGTGKTLAAIEILKLKQKKYKRTLRTIIFSPLVTLKNWKNEILKFSKIKEQDIWCLDESGKKRRDKLIQATCEDGVLIINYEALRSIDTIELLINYNADILICDESHRLKNHQSKQSKTIYKLSRNIKYKLLLTGTPILNSTMDIFQQYKILDGGDIFGTNYFLFRSKYFFDKNAGMPRNVHFPKWTPQPEKNKELQFLIKRKSDRILKKDCLDLPPLIKHKHYVTMGGEQARCYKSMARDFITFIKEANTGKLQASIAQLAVTKLLRLQQIVSGFVKTDNGEEHLFNDNPRAKALGEMLVTLSVHNKIIVWTTFKADVRVAEQICKDNDIGYCLLTGDQNGREKERSIDDFTTSDEKRVIIANRRAGGIGVNLVEAKYAITFSRDFSLEAELQSEARNYRGGSEKFDSIIKIDLITKDTVDEEVQKALENKQTISDIILDLKL